MRGLNVLLLGRPRIEVDGQPLTRLLGAKPQALVYFLAAEGGGPVPRSQLATLLWGSLDEGSARANLRLALTRLRQRLPGVIDADAQSVGLARDEPVFVDLERIEAIAAQPADVGLDALEGAAALVRGPFLEGFELPAADAFEDWLRRERTRCQRSAVRLVRQLAESLEAAGMTGRAIAAAQRWIELDDADETAHRRLMTLLAASGERTAAIAQYESLRRILAETLGARPSAETYELYRRIHADAPPPQRVAAPEPVAEPGSPDADARAVAHVPRLIGRAQELAEITQRLDDPSCAALTLVGPAGIGKTRLALAAADAMRGRFPDGTAFVSADGLDGRDDALVTLADAIAAQAGASRSGSSTVPESLARALAGRRMLLVLDNLESVAGAGVMLAALQASTPGLKVLATSRRRLGGSREWLYEVPGLSLARHEGENAGLSAAARLFVQEARRLDAGFDVGANLASVERICARVDGMPLAIEIAARAVRIHGFAGLEERIATGELPADPDRQEGDRHASVERVIRDAWERLDEPLRQALVRLSVLPGGFEPRLAESAADVDSRTLRALRDQSWLRGDARGRLSLHPLQREFARRQSEQSDARENDVLERLAAHWLACLRGAIDAAPPPVDADALEQIRVAAAHRVAGPDDAALVEFVDAAVAFLLAQGAWKDASRLLRFAVERQSLARWQRGLWILRMADIEKHSGDVERAWSRFAQALELLGFGGIESSRGTALDVLRVLARAGAIDREVPEPLRGGVYGAAVSALIGLGQLAGFAGEGGLCARLGLLALAVAQRTDDRDACAVGFAGFAYGSLLLGSAGIARASWRRARRLAPPPNHGPKAAFAQETIAAYEYAAGHWHLALPRLDETAAAMRRLRQPRHEVECRSLAAKLLALQGRLEEAQRRFVELGESVRGSEQTYTQHWSLLGIVETALRTGSHSAQQLLALLDEARREMSDVQTIDSAYVIRWLGLRAAACALAGDQDGMREAAISGASVIERVRICGFWAHEGFGGIAEALVACRERDRALGMSGSALDPALQQAMRGFERHVSRFPPGRARLHYCRGLLAASNARSAEAANELRKAVRLADRFGLRHELARACERLGRLDDIDAAGAWLERARRLYEETGARVDLDRMAAQPCGRPASIRVAV